MDIFIATRMSPLFLNNSLWNDKAVLSAWGTIYHVLKCTKINALYQLLSRYPPGNSSSLRGLGDCLQSRMPKVGSSCHGMSSYIKSNPQIRIIISMSRANSQQSPFSFPGVAMLNSFETNFRQISLISYLSLFLTRLNCLLLYYKPLLLVLLAYFLYSSFPSPGRRQSRIRRNKMSVFMLCFKFSLERNNLYKRARSPRKGQACRQLFSKCQHLLFTYQ
jgi:hypothetical protein